MRELEAAMWPSKLKASGRSRAGCGGGAQAARVPLNEYEFPTSKVANVQSQLERLVEKNYYLHASAREAYRGYLLAYNSHQLKDAFNVHTLDLQAVARSFGFDRPPRVRAPPLPALPNRLLHVEGHCAALVPAAARPSGHSAATHLLRS